MIFHPNSNYYPSTHQTNSFISMELSPSPTHSQYNKTASRRKTSGDSDYSDFLETESNYSMKGSRIIGSSKKIAKKNPSFDSQIQTPSSQKSGLRTRNSWTEAEDEQVLELIKVHGPKWTKIALIMGGRTGKQVRDRYLNVLTPHINKASWTQEEDKMIMLMYQQYGAQWRRISEYLKGRTETQVKNRYYTNLKKRSGGLVEEEPEINFLESFAENTSEVFTEQSPCKFFDMSDRVESQETERTKFSSGHHTSRSCDSFEFVLDNSVPDFMGSEMVSYKNEERGYDDSCFEF